MNERIIKVDDFYGKRPLYSLIPPAVFDALETAYLEGRETVAVPESEYLQMMSNLNSAKLCHER